MSLIEITKYYKYQQIMNAKQIKEYVFTKALEANIKTQGHSMVSGSGKHFYWIFYWVIADLVDEGTLPSSSQARNYLDICVLHAFIWIIPVFHDHHLTNLKSFQILSGNFNLQLMFFLYILEQTLRLLLDCVLFYD